MDKRARARPASAPRAVLFDAYGTMFDVYSVGLLAEQLCPGHGERLAQLWRDKQIEYTRLTSMSGRYRPFWDLTRAGLRYAALRLCLVLDAAAEDRLMNQYRHLSAFPENRDVLQALHDRGVPAGILSNGDPEMLAVAVKSAGFVDLLAHVPETFLTAHVAGEKGGMVLVDDHDIAALVAKLGTDYAVTPGGSAALAPAVVAVRTPRLAIITDLLGDAEELLSVARLHVVAHGEVHLVHVVASEELDPPRRPLLALDPERPGLQRMLIEPTRAAYETRFAQWRTEMANQWRAAGGAYSEVVTSEPAAHAVRRIAEPATQ